MTTIVNVNGTEITVPIPDGTIEEIKIAAHNDGYNEGYNKGRDIAYEYICRDIFDVFISQAEYERPGEILLTEDEEDTLFKYILDKFGRSHDDHICAIIRGQYKTAIEEGIGEIADNRKGLFAVPIEVTTTVTVYIKAKTEDAAISYAEDISDWELKQLADEEDFQYEVQRYDVEEVDEYSLPYCYEPYEADD